MKTRWIALLALAAPWITACEGEEIGLQIVSVNRVQLSDCVVTSDEETRLSSGAVDLAIAGAYSVFPVVENRLVDTPTAVKLYGESDGRIHANDITITSAVVRYTTLDQISAPLPEEVVVPISHTARLNEQQPMGVEIFSPAQLQLIRQSPEFLIFDAQNQVRPVRTSAKVIVRIKLRGTTLDGKDIESNEFVFPVEICNGCSITYPPQAIETNAQQVPNCQRIQDDATTLTGLDDIAPGCIGFLGTDGNIVDCRDCQGFAVDSIARQLCQPPLTP